MTEEDQTILMFKGLIAFGLTGSQMRAGQR